MGYQTQSGGYLAFKLQDALGTQASGAGAKVFRTTGGTPGRMSKAATENDEVRRDGMRSRGRHGTQKTQGAPSGHVSIGSYDDVIAAVMRGNWGPADLEIDEGDFTSITTTANSIVFASGSPIALGLRVHEVIRLTNHASAENNNRNLRITALDETTVTVADTLTVNNTPDTDAEITRPGSVLINPAAGSLVKRYFTWEEHEVDIDGSEISTDVVFGGLTFTMQTNGIFTLSAPWVGTGKFETKSGGDAPHFENPTETTTEAMSVVDATIRLGNQDLVELTAFDLTLDLAPNAPDVFGSGQIKYAPDVFTGQMAVSMNLTALRKDLAYVAKHLAEDALSLHVLAVDNAVEPKPFISIAVPNFTLGGVEKAALNKAGGPMTQTIQVPAALVGKDMRGGAYSPTMVKFQRSNVPA